ncbi:MAG: hypothetical protein COU31_00420 [Candidatus Magasanikbacteria bacterium CG10_big_fil_rev_8_21_14_0_10_40_10]|uniref:Amine oxidase domain-containing protein n=1 Tax=Candidatus Magasanikbacteria bacterium CG10_big_fil_rev_8_21_14_0_10_40_10 TaxID=1974648 RepID=A0A2M6W5D3_9BACT|nr:MAG: hypothetical protein COU31_00420 [Candidatus Magasanikbacteria bacterium CG10_big_fil_rev_8_21_14_0_10_40_10]
MASKKVLIIGAGPAGLTAAFELLKEPNYEVVILEKDDCVGGISRTVNYQGNRIDIGGHRFFSKSDWVMDWWKKILPSQEDVDQSADQTDKIMLTRNRISRIYYLRKFFNYPVNLSLQTIKNLGLWRIFKIGLSYFKARILPIKKEKNLRDFFINRFGKELYLTFFKDYTEKVWGAPCENISPEWGAQRIKGLSVSKAIGHAIKSLALNKKRDLAQKNIETSLISRFLYPKYGPGQMWEAVADLLNQKKQVKILFHHQVVGLEYQTDKITSVRARDLVSGQEINFLFDYVLSTMPVKDLVQAMKGTVPNEVKEIARALQYRDFITVGLLAKQLKIKDQNSSLIKDNWIYIQEPDVKLGRLQIFNNWSPYMLANPAQVWLGLEYFCQENDKLWNMADEDLKKLGIEELSKIDIIETSAIVDGVVIRMPKTYPAYFGAYEHFAKIRNFTDSITNLFLIGRNGMHRYNNMDHSMLSARQAVANILNGLVDKTNIWQVNAEQEYHEQKKHE